MDRPAARRLEAPRGRIGVSRVEKVRWKPSDSPLISDEKRTFLTEPVKPIETPAPLREGDPAPDFLLQDEKGQLVRLSDFRGKRLILYFYPKDDTPGCTLEACNFRDELQDFEKARAVIVGVSIDSPASHQQFKNRYQLTFPLLSDSHREVVRQYGVWKEKTVLGIGFRWTERATFVIDEQGIIRKIFRRVKVGNHTQEILKALALLP